MGLFSYISVDKTVMYTCYRSLCLLANSVRLKNYQIRRRNVANFPYFDMQDGVQGRPR